LTVKVFGYDKQRTANGGAPIAGAPTFYIFLRFSQLNQIYGLRSQQESDIVFQSGKEPHVAGFEQLLI